MLKIQKVVLAEYFSTLTPHGEIQESWVTAQTLMQVLLILKLILKR